VRQCHDILTNRLGNCKIKFAASLGNRLQNVTVQAIYKITFIKQYSPFFSLGTGLVALLSRKKRETLLDSGNV